MTRGTGSAASHPSRVVLGVTGSVAATLAPTLATAFRLLWSTDVRVVVTEAALTFVTVPALAVTTGHPVVGPGPAGADRGVVDHMDLARWADLVVVAPATANTIGQVAHGLATDVLGSCILATEAPVVLAPSMNPSMWRNPRVQRNVGSLVEDGFGIVPPVLGTAMVDMAAGVGAMPPAPALLRWLEAWLADPSAAPSFEPPILRSPVARQAG